MDYAHLVATDKSHQNRAVIDPWTAVHFSTGLAAGLMELPLEECLAVAFSYEVVEQVVERQKWGRDLFKSSGPESFLNAAMDTAVFALGHWLGGVWNRSGARSRVFD